MGDSPGDIITDSTVENHLLTVNPRKRRRIQKACDDCRKRKVKCDGALPCKACIDFAQECIYTQSTQRKARGAQYVDDLEKSVYRLKSILSKVFPDRDIDDPLFETNVKEQVDAVRDTLYVESKNTPLYQFQTDGYYRISNYEYVDLLDTMIEASGHLNIDGRGHCNFEGHFGGLSFLRRIGERCNQLLDTGSLKRNISGPLPLPQAGRSARSLLNLARTEPITTCILPSEAAAIRITRITLEDACCLMNFIHQPSFDHLMHRVYHLGAEKYTSEDETFLPLLYMTLAMGEIFSPLSKSHEIQQGNSEKIRGSKYFCAAESLLDTMDCNDMHSLQALVCIVMYLQAAGLMHSCYTYISVAIASAHRMGLHRSTTSNLLDPIQQETRKRLFWVLRTMETYVTTLIGMPLIINDSDVDQPLPLEIEDHSITANGILRIKEDSISPMAVANAHTKLLIIMREVIRDIYPHTNDLGGHLGSYRVNYARVAKVEAELENWFRNIPQPPPNQTVPPKVLRVQLLLRLAYAHVQMVLYRPFIHHIVRKKADEPPEMRSYACASACIKAAMQIIWLVEEMDVQGVLIPSDWFLCYMTFFAVMSLCMFILGNTNDLIIHDAVAAAEKGRKILDKLASQSQCARYSKSVETLLDRMSLYWSKRNNAVVRSRDHTAEASGFQQGPDTAGNGTSTSTVAENETRLHTTSTPALPSSFTECSTASESLSQFSITQNEHEQQELLAMIYPMAGSSPFEPELNTSSESLYPRFYDTTQFCQNLDQGNIPSSFI